jgi:hypothetical protein
VAGTVVLAANGWSVGRYSDLSEDFYFDLVFRGENIPYSIDAVKIGDLALFRPKYWDLSNLSVLEVEGGTEDEKVFWLIDVFSGCEYLDGQNNPALLFEEGGDCQARAVYFKRELDRIGVRNGFVAEDGHVFNWVVVKDRLAKVDLVEGSFGSFSRKEKEILLSFVPELKGVVDYVELG